MKKHSFTLIETVVAVAVLGMSLTVLFQLLAQARSRIARAADAWNNVHRVTEAAEYVLLHGDTLKQIPPEFFSYPDCHITVAWDDIADVHEEYTSISGQPDLKVCTVSLVRDSDGKILETVLVDRILYDNALTEE